MKMKRIRQLFTLLLIFAAATTICSCSETEDEDTEYENWQERNETYFANIYAQAQTNSDGTWKIIRNWSYNEDIATDKTDYIVVQVLNEGTGSGCPIYTDSVRVHYRGRIIPTTSYPSGYQFDSSWNGDYNLQTMIPSKFAIGDVVNGFATALQNMHIGDRWMVYIPYTLGYGTTATSSIPAYSTLIFDITLHSYWHKGTVGPDFK